MQGLQTKKILLLNTFLLSLQQKVINMIYSIAFKDLPFEPEERQVIYIENKYDERINAIIKSNYEQIKWAFKRANLDFVYLPMFFNDEETREKILYYAPYLTSDVIENTELRNSYLLGYMRNHENREKIAPSFIFSPKKENDEWHFLGLFLTLKKEGKNIFNSWIEDVIYEIEEETTPTLENNTARPDEDSDEGLLFRDDSSFEEEVPHVERSSTPRFWGRFLKKAKEVGHDIVSEEGDSTRIAKDTSEPSLEEIRDEDVTDILNELEEHVKKLRLGGMELTAIHRFIDNIEKISRLRITEDLRIFLPDYNNIEIELNAQNKAVYFLFLNHPEGIVLQQLENYHSELLNYYCRTSNVEEPSLQMIETINRLEYPTNNGINIIITRIKRAFFGAFDEHLAKNYIISGRRLGEYKITLSQDLIEWEDEYE